MNNVEMNMIGIDIQCLSYDEMYPIFDNWLTDKSSRSKSLAVINVHICVSALLNKDLRSIYNSVDMSGSDGMPFVMWARAFYKKSSDRFYAPDLMEEISSKAGEKDYTFFLYGGYEDAPDKIEEYLDTKYDGANVIGKYSPPFRPVTEKEDEEICDYINKLEPDFIWVGLGSPKQDVWIHEHRNKIKGSIMIPSGATFDFFSQRVRQAPKWIRDLGFEWFFRLTQDFKRLWKRYTIYNAIFLFFFTLQLLKVIDFNEDDEMLIFGKKTKFMNQ